MTGVPAYNGILTIAVAATGPAELRHRIRPSALRMTDTAIRKA